MPSATDDKSALWDAIEANYWQSTKAVRAREDREAEESRRAETEPIKTVLSKLYLERRELEDRLNAVSKSCLEVESRLDDLQKGNDTRRALVVEQRAHDDEAKRAWFKNYRQGGAADESSEVGHEDTGTDEAESQQASNGVSSPVADEPGEPSKPSSEEPHPPTTSEQQAQNGAPHGEKTGVEVYNGNGQLIGELHRIDLQNHWIDTIINLPIKRPVQIRSDKKFTAENLEPIYAPTDAKGAKWLACHVQAVGDVQAQPCHTCIKSVGVFSDCVIVGGDDFPRCGNCEWNRQGCHGASAQPRPTSRHAAGDEEKEGTALSRFSSQQPVDQAALSVHEIAAEYEDSELPMRPKSSNQNFQPDNVQDAHTPEEVAKRATSKQSKRSRRKQPAPQTPEADVQTNSQADPQAGEKTGEPELPEITKETLDLKDDGVVFTDPPCMRNVPLVKISPSHAYWEPEWKPIEDDVQLSLNRYMEKHAQLQSTPGSSSSSLCLANRQVNRGKTILRFLEYGELHPYQIIGKEWISKAFLGYDNLFRMIQVLEELPKFNLDIKPSEWLRQRLHELHVEQGDTFDLAKTVGNMYHDPKVAHLRIKNGYGNIGRPSGYKTGEKAKNGSTPTKEPRARKRKEPHTTTPKMTPQMERRAEKTPRSSQRKTRQDSAEVTPTPQASKAEPQQPIPQPRNYHKKQRTDHHALGRGGSGHANLQEDLDFNGYTSTDSFSKDHVMKLDWRVYQVKTPTQTTNPAVTQYWHWVDKGEAGGESNIFEHQVLKDVTPDSVSWGVYKDPFDFHLRLSELVDVSFAPGSQKVVISTKPVQGVEHRGEVLAHFKRERTKRRFLSFMKKKGVKLVRTNVQFVESAWDKMQSEVLPGYDSE